MKQRILISLLLCVLAIPGIAQPRKTVLPYRGGGKDDRGDDHERNSPFVYF